MPANRYPIFIQRPQIGWSNTIVTTNTTKDGTTGTFERTMFQSGAASGNAEGSYVDYVRVKSLGTNLATVGRVFLCIGLGDRTVANDNFMLSEITLPATTWTETTALPDFTVPLKIAIPHNANLYVSIANTINAGWQFTTVGGDYVALSPMFVDKPQSNFSGTVTTQNQTRFGTGTLTQVWRSPSSNVIATYLDHIRIKPIGTNVASVARVWINNGGVTTVANNNTLFTEVALPAITLNEAIGQVDIPISMKLFLPQSYNVYVTLGTTVAAGWTFTGIGGVVTPP